jgi:hypothetical protein
VNKNEKNSVNNKPFVSSACVRGYDYVGPKPVDSEPVNTEPVDSEPVNTEPIDAKPVNTEPVDSEPIDAESVDSESVGSDLFGPGTHGRRRTHVCN